MYQIHKLCVLGVSLSFTILVKSQQPQCGVTRVFYLSLAADKLLMALLKGSRVVGQSRWGCWEGSVGRGNLGEPWAAEGGADGREAHISDHQVSSFWFFFLIFWKFFYFCLRGGQKGTVQQQCWKGGRWMEYVRRVCGSENLHFIAVDSLAFFIFLFLNLWKWFEMLSGISPFKSAVGEEQLMFNTCLLV